MAGAYGDMVATFGLDDRLFERGLRGVERKGARTGQRLSAEFGRSGRGIDREFGRSIDRVGARFGSFGAKSIGALIGVGSATRSLSAGLREAAQSSGVAEAALRRLEKSGAGFLRSLGEDFAYSGIPDMLASGLDGLGRGKDGARDVIARIMGRDPGDWRSFRAWERGLSTEKRQGEAIDPFRRSAEISRAESMGDSDTASRLREAEALRKAMEQLNGLGLSANTIDTIRGFISEPFVRGRQDDARRRGLDRFGISQEIEFGRRGSISDATGDADGAARVAAERKYRGAMLGIERDRTIDPAMRGLMEQAASEEYEQTLRKINREAQDRNRLAREAVGFETRGLEIDNLRARGKERQAKAAEAVLEYDRRVAEINRRRDIAPEDRARFIRAAGEARDAALAGDGPGGARELSIGLGARVNSQVLGGPGSSGGTAGERNIVAELKRANQNLRKIEAKVGTWA